MGEKENEILARIRKGETVTTEDIKKNPLSVSTVYEQYDPTLEKDSTKLKKLNE